MEYQVDIIGLAPLIARCEEVGADAQPMTNVAVAQAAVAVQSNVRVAAPHVTGTLQRSIMIENTDAGTAIVKTNEKYAAYVEYGTAAHVIMPKTKKALSWKGAPNPFALVHHPGTKANPFFARGVASSADEIADIFQNLADTIAGQLAEGA